MELSKKLKEQGWHLTDDGIKKLIAANGCSEATADVRKIISTALDVDYRDIAGGALPTKRDDTIAGRIVLQVQKVRNISAPKANEESKAAPRFLQLELSDGVTAIQALELETIAALSLNVPPGTKLYFRPERLQLMQGFLILRSAELQVLGGRVEALVEKWELARTMQKYARSGRRMSGASGPPPWIAFGKKMDAIKETMPRDRNFKSLLVAGGEKDKDKDSKENEEFNAMRTEAIAEASKAGAKKIFGGGGQQILDHNVKKILEKGYSEEEAKLVLRSTNNNLERALYNLKRRQDYNRYEDEAKTSQRDGSTVQASKFGRGGGAGGPPREREFTGRRGGAASLKDEAAAAKPAGNVSLFDFLTDKLPANTETTSVSQSAAAPATSTVPSYHTSSSTTSASKFDKSKSDIPKSNYNKFTSSKSEDAERTRSKFENNLSSSFNAHRSTGGPRDVRGGRSERHERDYNASEHSSNSRYSNSRGGAGGGGSSRGGRGGNTSTYQGNRPSYQEGNSGQRNFTTTRDSAHEQRSSAGGSTRGSNANYNQSSSRGGGLASSRASNERSAAPTSSGGNEERSSQPRSGTSSGGFASRQKASDQQNREGERYGHFNENKPYEKNRYNQRENNNKGNDGSSRQQQGSYNSNNSNNNNSNSNTDHSRMNKLVESTSKLKIDKAREQTSSGGAGGGRPQKQSATTLQSQTQPKQQQQQYSQPENLTQQPQPTPPPPQQQQQAHYAASQTSQPKYAQPQQQNQNFSNGFNYDPSKIIGFQNKETNDFALTLLKSQGAASTSVAQQAVALPPPPTQSPHNYIPAVSPMQQQHAPLASPYGNPGTYLLHSPQAAAVPPPTLGGQYGMVPGDGWLWKIGDLCLAKYWDDGRYYEAEITAISAKTCVVFFLGYGNHEEVLKSDCLPITDANHRPINNYVQQQQQVVAPPPPPAIQPNGFQRGGGGSQRYRGERQVYVPPPKRDN